MIALHVILLVLLHLAVLAGLLAVILGLGGNFILLGIAFLTAWAGGFEHLSWTLLLLCAALAVVGEVVESLLGVLTARGFGASRWGMIGTFVGGIGGAILGTAWVPVLGSLVGAFAGGFAGAFAGEMLGGRNIEESLKAGFGGFLGRVAATTFKFGVGALIATLTLRAGWQTI